MKSNEKTLQLAVTALLLQSISCVSTLASPEQNYNSSADNPLPLRGALPEPTSSSPAQTQDQSNKSIKEDNSVNAFFQCSGSRAAETSTAAATDGKYLTPTAVRRVKSTLWNLFDILGVPMIVGHDEDLAPSIQRNIKISEECEGKPESGKLPENAKQQKIPQSELEGTIYEAPGQANVVR